MDIRNKSSDEEEDPMAKKGLPYLLHKEAYKDAFILQDESSDDPVDKELREKMEKDLEKNKGIDKDFTTEHQLDVTKEKSGEKLNIELPDARKDMNDTWTRFFKYQPMWKIRNYFGEKIAFYFAWSGMLISSLWLPTLFGLGVFAYGMYLSITAYNNRMNQAAANMTGNATTDGILDQVKDTVQDVLDIIKESFDNEVTPWFALCICLWGTIFLEFWKRKNATLAYEWDVNNFDETEPDRPQFHGTKRQEDPVTKEESWYYPLRYQVIKFLASGSVLIFMVTMVFISVAGVIVYRVIINVDYCSSLGAAYCLILTTVVSSVLNATSILILGKIYDKLAVKLTDWENHRTQSAYDNALIVKLFAFQFANCYTSLFYIAFFRGERSAGGILGLGDQYVDDCGVKNNCMSMLSFQVLVLMIMKPFPKFLKDVIIPWLRGLWRRRKCCRAENKVNSVPEIKVSMNDYLERERLKPLLGDFTLGEYTEKVVMYGYLMLFAASFPLAPLIALLTILVDIRVDARRLLWMYRRPIAHISQNIGMWYGILQFMNVAGVISNAFLIAFTSSYGKNNLPSITDKLWYILAFEHGIFAVKFLLQGLIPDTPARITLREKKEKYQVARIMEKAAEMNATVMLSQTQIPRFPDTSNHQDDVGGGIRHRRKNGKEGKLEPPHRRSSSLEAGRSPVQYDSDGQIVRPNGGGRRVGKSPRGARTPRTPRQDDEHALLDDPEPYDAATAEQTKKKKKKKKRRKSEEGGDDVDTPRPGPNSPSRLRRLRPILPRIPSEEEAEPGPATLRLSYGQDGSTYYGEEDKFMGSPPHSPVSDKSRFKSLPPMETPRIALPDNLMD